MKAQKLVCTKTESLEGWEFTEGKTYKVWGDWNYDPHVIADNGATLWLFKYGEIIRGAGVDAFHFQEAR